jgi:hypothetical protein
VTARGAQGRSDKFERAHAASRVCAQFPNDIRRTVKILDSVLHFRDPRAPGRVIERRLPLRTMAVADAQNGLAKEIEDDNLMGVAIGNPDAIPSVDRDTMRIEDFSRAIGSDESSIRFVNDDRRRLSAAEDMHPSRRFHRDLADAGWREVGRRATKITLHGIPSPAQQYMADLTSPGHRACSR